MPDAVDEGPRATAVAPRPAPEWLLLAVVCIGQFMVVLDVSIVNVALPAMQRNLGFSTAQLQWVVNAYALTFGGFLLLGGRAADLFGRRKVFVLGLAMFSGASLVCALAPNQGTLVGARALQGLGAAVLSPATLTILTTAFRQPAARARALGLWSGMAAVGGAMGGLLGGVLTDLLSWRWIFYINIPIGIAVIVAARMALVESRAETVRRRLDVPGALTVTGALLALVYAVAGTSTHAWTSAATDVPLALAAGLLGAFVVLERRAGASALVPFRLFRSRGVAGSNLSMLLMGGAMFSFWLFLSLYMQDVLGLSPLVTGVGFLPQTVAVAVASQISARLVARLGPRPPLFVGVLLAGVGLAWLSRISPVGNYAADVLGGSTLTTFGMGLCYTPLAFAATAGVAREEAGLASGTLNTARQVGGSIGLAVLATIAADRTRSLVAVHGASVSEHVRALTSGFDRAFAVSSTMALAAFFAALIIPRARATSAAVVAGTAPAGHEVGAAALAVEPET